MSEIKAMRLAQAAAFYNVSMDHLVEELKKNGETVVNNPSTKIAAELVMVLDKAFNKDKAIKAQADRTKMVEKTAHTLGPKNRAAVLDGLAQNEPRHRAPS